MKKILSDKIYYVGEHISCNNYMHNIEYGFTYRVLDENSTESIVNLDKNLVIFLLEGRGVINYISHSLTCNIMKNEIIFLAKHSSFSYSISEKAKVLLFTFESPISGCDRHVLEEGEIYARKSIYKFEPLKMVYPLNEYAKTLSYCLEKGVNCTHFHEIKHREFFMYLRFFYKKEEISNFLYPIIGQNYDFRQFILREWQVGVSMDEVINRSSMSKSTFIRAFKENFTTTPYAWYQKQVCNILIEKIIYPETTIKDLMEVTCINDPSQFNRFCRRNFKCTPKELFVKYRKLDYDTNSQNIETDGKFQ